ncbi:MFS transporter [Carnimonas nigrificans]|uniref:MFS transporter n=1 Tax=Carnimonas nigrificans TaxID=64323 RepID=UPI0004AFF614|nr:MFS transporter [Carnimonas nigrificans]
MRTPSGTPTTIKKGRKIRNLRWFIVIFALLAGIINYMDRSALSISAPELMEEFNFSAADIGLMGTVFSWIYAVSQLPAGWVTDRMGTRRVYAGAIAGWSICIGLVALCTRFWHFLLLRALLGITESPNSPASAKMTSDWFPRSERSHATAIWDSGSKWGPAIAPPILTLIMIGYGWRAIYIFLGIIGVALAVSFFIFYRKPSEHPNITDEELELITRDKQQDDLSGADISWMSMFKYRQVWGMMLGYFCIIWIWNIFIVFLPLYLQKAQGISILQSGWLAAIPFLGAAILEFLGGYVMTRMNKRSSRSPLSLKLRYMGFSTILAGLLVCMLPLMPNLTSFIVVMTLAIGFVANSQGIAWTLAGDVIGSRKVSSLGAVQNFGGYFGGAFAPLVTGIIVDATGSFTIPIIVGGVIAACAALAYGGLVRKPILVE